MKLKIIETTEHLDLDLVRKNFLKLEEFKKISKNFLPKDMRELIASRIKLLRSEIKSCSTQMFKVQVSNGREVYWEIMERYPKADEIKGAVATFKKRIKEVRAKRKEVKTIDKEMLGFRYKMQEGVFVKSNSILDIVSQTNPIERIRRTKKPHESVKSNYVGVEIEFICRCEKDALETALVQAGLAGYVRVGSDSSINRENSGEWTFEITCLFKEGEAKSVLTRLCKVLSLPYIAAYVNNTCGLHVHMDARNRDHKILYHNLVQCLPLLTSMVPSDRVKGIEGRTHYCQLNKESAFDKALQNGRYQAINPEAYSKYKTIEVRLHSGSTNAAKIINWVTILTGIANVATKTEHPVTTVEELNALFEVTSKLGSYINKRIELFKTKQIPDTRTDHFSSIEYDAAV